MTDVTVTRLSGEERRAQILASARAEFLARGYGGSRIQSVADHAGVNVGLLYKHFESKDHLFDAAVVQPLHDHLEQRIAEIREMPADANGAAQHETTRRFMRTLLETFFDSIESLGVLLFDDQDQGRQFYVRHLDPLIETAVAASRDTLSRWPHREFDIDIVMRAVFGMAFWTALDHTMTGRAADVDVISEQLASVLFNGMRAR